MALDDPSLTFHWPEETAAPKIPSHPVDVQFETDGRAKRLWAIPVVGFVAKTIMLIPHFICLICLGWLAGMFLTNYWQRFIQTLLAGNFLDASIGPFAVGEALAGFVALAGVQLVLWVPVLFGGRYPNWGYALVGGYIRWSVRAGAFWLGLTDQYPPFSLKSMVNDRPTQVHVSFSIPQRSVRWWAIPLVAIWGKLIILIPHFVCLAVLGLVSGIAYLILWIPVLITGRYPTWGYTLLGGTLRWSTRVNAYLFGLTDAYPPFAVD
ncbi:MAG: DUF4389 domain-containing protein [Chloroflexi bacterium]|nr:DUF4389 domain-containing protein [Chloroflexota bacterium]